MYTRETVTSGSGDINFNPKKTFATLNATLTC